jgi:hypothetical protein
MAGESWQDLAKDYVLWQSQRGGDVELMLQRTPTNSRTNQDLARFTNALTNITNTWRGKYKGMWGDIPARLEEGFLTMEGYSRKQAIELAAAVAKASAPVGAPEEKKRGGLLGLFGR